MRYTLLGRSGIRVSQLCLGTMVFGEYYNHDWGSGLDKAASGRILDAFADAGGNFVDTADYYTGGASETILGELLHGRRDRFVLATKYTMQTDTGDLNTAGSHRKNLAVSLERSLRRLQTDYVDLLWVHAYDTLTSTQEVMRALDDQVRAGKVLHVAVSNWPAWEISAANTLADLRGWSPFVALQIKYSLMERTPERELMPLAKAYDLAVTAWSPLAGGLLTGKYLGGPDGVGTGRVVAYDERTERVARVVVDVAAESGSTPAAVALAWLLAQRGTVIPIIGATDEGQLAQNLACLDLLLTDDQVARLNEVSAVDPGYPHDFLQVEHILNIVYGRDRGLVDDRRSR
jgi:aryl-alcohol dehydrogenase-like predicted oxidoreductase